MTPESLSPHDCYQRQWLNAFRACLKLQFLTELIMRTTSGFCCCEPEIIARTLDYVSVTVAIAGFNFASPQRFQFLTQFFTRRLLREKICDQFPSGFLANGSTYWPIGQSTGQWVDLLANSSIFTPRTKIAHPPAKNLPRPYYDSIHIFEYYLCMSPPLHKQSPNKLRIIS